MTTLKGVFLCVHEKHKVSYNNIYSWVQRYKEHGPAKLIDGRGKPDMIQIVSR
ncbi:helix-turn-helix domain-containing protein [Cerasibacillus terrae]|uniref:Helix-turn-helix domain-containing protein n=1 Tax=Cerasibacillus terrae TaxID=2498845 RepID=A0A5C8NKK7_9BACI|nr:helix-turn-helix domain-containing protein [Cerasibacillus terrae]